MGHLEFGRLAHLRRIIFFKLSPHEQKAFTGIISHSMWNVPRRIYDNIFVVAPPFIGGYCLYSYVKNLHHHMTRKNPKDYENDV